MYMQFKRRPEEGIFWTLWNWSYWRLPANHVAAGNWTHVIHKINECSKLQSHLSSLFLLDLKNNIKLFAQNFKREIQKKTLKPVIVSQLNFHSPPVSYPLSYLYTHYTVQG